MKNRSKWFTISCSLLFMLMVLHATSTLAQEVEDESEFDYLEGSERGPWRWGELKKEWATCNHGDLQSPIDMLNQRVKIIRKSRELKINYKPCNATVRNRGHDLMVQWDENKAGSIQINGTEYFLQQAHWHSPSEHTINGRRYDVELHMVHLSSDLNAKNTIAVTGLLYKFGKADAFLSKLTGNMVSMIDTTEERNLGVIDPREIKMGGKYYYRYMGSLTTPPCTEGVIWTMNKKVRTVSRDQAKLLRDAVHDHAENNARPLQPLNRRDIHLYAP